MVYRIKKEVKNMEREKILKQIQNLTEKSGFSVGYNEMAKYYSFYQKRQNGSEFYGSYR